jgi:hypothetical protein
MNSEANDGKGFIGRETDLDDGEGHIEIERDRDEKEGHIEIDGQNMEASNLTLMEQEVSKFVFYYDNNDNKICISEVLNLKNYFL